MDWWLRRALGYDLGADQLNQLLHQIENTFKDNPNTVLNGVSRVGSTAADVATGVLLTLFTLLFLPDGGRTHLAVRRWSLPQGCARGRERCGPTRAGSPGAYVRVQILVAAIDAIGIGLGAAILGCPGDSAGRAGVPGFLYPVIGALFSGCRGGAGVSWPWGRCRR